MEQNIESRWITLPRVDIEFGSIMTVNRQYVSIPDITAETLADYIQIGKTEIDYELDRALNRRKFYDIPAKRPVILLGRLAVIGEERAVFASPDQLLEDRDFDMDDIKAAYREHWISVLDQGYTPIVESNLDIASPTLAGTWLGLKRPL